MRLINKLYLGIIAGWYIFVVFSISMLLFSSCTNRAYKKVASDTTRSEKHKRVLLQICEQIAPPAGVVYIKGKDSILTVTDTVTYFTTDTVTKTVTAYRDITNTRYISRTDTVRVPDSKLNALIQSELNECKSVADKQAGQLQAEKDTNQQLRERLRHAAFIKWMGWIVVFGAVILRILKALKFIAI